LRRGAPSERRREYLHTSGQRLQLVEREIGQHAPEAQAPGLVEPLHQRNPLLRQTADDQAPVLRIFLALDHRVFDEPIDDSRHRG